VPENVRRDVSAASSDEVRAATRGAQQFESRLPREPEQELVATDKLREQELRIGDRSFLEEVCGEIRAERMTHRDPAKRLGAAAAFVVAALESAQADLPVREIDVRSQDPDQLAHAAAGFESDANEKPIAIVAARRDELRDLLAREVLRERRVV
jgi:hypothetical protein